MSDTKVADKNKIPQREDIDEKRKWDLSELFADESAWETAFVSAEKEIESAQAFAGKLSGSPETLFDCLEKRSQLGLDVFQVYQYAKLRQDLDNRVSKFQAMTDRAAMLSSKADAAYSFVEPELMKIDDDKLKEMSANFPKTDVYDFYINDLIRTRKHIRSEEVEELLSQTAMIARGPSSVFTMIDNADVVFPSIKDEKGNEIPLTKQRFAKFMESPDQRVRADAHNGVHGYYKGMVNTIASSISTEVNKNIFFAKARKHDSSLSAALDSNNIPVEVYRSLIKTTEDNLTGIHKWMELRKKILKLDNIYPYDVYCPLFPDYNYDIPYDEAVKTVVEATRPLGDEYTKVLEKAFADRWVDVYETEGKSGGAYNWGNYKVHPFIKMNYNETIDNMFTLGHEMGHALHSWLSCRNQPLPKSQYSIFVAEVASTLNEGLLQKHLLGKTEDDKMKRFLLNRHINNTLGTFYNQVFFADFELSIHEKVEKGDALSPEFCNELWAELTKKYYGPALTIDDHTQYKWARIPHFYMNFYVYQYATSYAASQAILQKFNDGEEGIIDKYLGLISSGGNDYPINQLKKCGIDMTTPEPFEATIKLFDKQVDEIEKLTS